MEIIEQITLLPIELNSIIFDFLPNYKKIMLNKYYYDKFHYLIRPMILKMTLCGKTSGLEHYIREIIKKNHYCPFEQLINENFNKWLFMKKYRYKNMIFSNYIKFLIYYCNENDSTDCLNKLLTNDKYIKIFGINEKQHKNIINTSIRWTN